MQWLVNDVYKLMTGILPWVLPTKPFSYRAEPGLWLEINNRNMVFGISVHCTLCHDLIPLNVSIQSQF